MRPSWLSLSLLLVTIPLAAQAPPKRAPMSGPTPPPFVEGYVVTAEIKALAPELKPVAKAPTDAQALTEKIRQQTQVVSRFYLTRTVSRQEILSTDFILPAGTVVMHSAGDRAYLIADPTQKTYVVMDAGTLLTALEGSAGVLNSQYEADFHHTQETKSIAGISCRKSIVTVKYASQMPFEGSTVLVQLKNEIEIWHTSSLVSSAAMDHLFFKFQQDKTNTVRKVLSTEIGFPMEVKLIVPGTGKKAGTVQPGSFSLLVTEVKKEPKLLVDMFRIPPADYRRLDRNPYFKDLASPTP